MLQLDLHTIPPSGMVPQVLTWTRAFYEKTYKRAGIDIAKVEIFVSDALIVDVEVEIIT